MDKDFLKLAKQNINKSIDDYLAFILTCDWTNKESYKFEFANWINSKVSITTDSNQKILNACIKSQKIPYSGTNQKGIQFLKKSGRKKLSSFISIEDVEIFKEASKNGTVSESECRKRSISYTGLSGWLGTLCPLVFVPVPVSDFSRAFSFLFNLEKIQKKGFRAFSDFLFYSQCIREEFKKRKGLEWVYLNHINSFRTSFKLIPKSEYELYDLNWLVEDFVLYVHRIQLNLRDTSYLTPKVLPPIIDVKPNSRTLITINRIDRDSKVVEELKKIYENNCQICSLSSTINKKTFVEGAHIKPLGGIHNGSDSLDNLLCLCPNHHKLFDLGEFYINTNLELIGLKEIHLLNLKHSIDFKNFTYHQREIYENAQSRVGKGNFPPNLSSRFTRKRDT